MREILAKLPKALGGEYSSTMGLSSFIFEDISDYSYAEISSIFYSLSNEYLDISPTIFGIAEREEDGYNYKWVRFCKAVVALKANGGKGKFSLDNNPPERKTPSKSVSDIFGENNPFGSTFNDIFGNNFGNK